MLIQYHMHFDAGLLKAFLDIYLCAFCACEYTAGVYMCVRVCKGGGGACMKHNQMTPGTHMTFTPQILMTQRQRWKDSGAV